MASKGSEVTDPQTTDLLREAGMQLKARHYFLTLLAHKRIIQGGTQYLTAQHKQGRIASSGRAEEAGVLSRQGWLHLSLALNGSGLVKDIKLTPTFLQDTRHTRTS